MTAILGIDLSLTSTGLALLYGDEFGTDDLGGVAGAIGHVGLTRRDRAWTKSVQTNPKDYPDMGLRWAWIVSQIEQMAEYAQFLVIEGYSYGSAANARACMELGGIVRYILARPGRPIREIPPSTLKKFVVGSGGKGVDKDQMLLQAYKRWGVEFRTNDECDAYGLAKIGQALTLGAEGLPQFQIEMINDLRAPRVKKKRSKKAATL
jgi:Holliday junction resolvasome RuvABC endonuclease subunit